MRGVSVLLLLLFNLSVSSQISNKVDIVRGTEYEGKRSRIQSLLGSTDEGIVVCRYDKKTPYIELIGEKGNVLRSVSLAELKYNKLNKLLIGGFVLKKRLFIRFSVEDNGNKKTITIIDEYDSNQLAFIRNISTESASTDVAKKVAWYGIGLARTMSERSENGFDISNSENFAMQYSSDFERNKNTNEKVSFKVFDMNMEEKWSKEFEIPYTNDQFQIASVIVDDNGNVHLLGTESFEGTKEKANFRYHVLSFLEEGTRVKDNVLELEANFITDASIGIAGDGYLLAAGFYGNVSGSSIDGSFSTKIDIDQQKVIFASKKEFDKEFIQDGMTEREKKKSDKKEEKGKDLNLPEFNLNHLVLSDDGSWHLIAEQFYITQTTQMVAGSNGHMQSRTVTNYNFNDVIVIKMNSNGEVVFNTKIVKEQSSSNGISPALSYVSGYCNGDIYIVYNEHIFSKNNNVIACKISSDGTLTQEAIIKAKDERFEIYPTYSMYIKNCQIMLYIDTKKRYQFNFMNIQ